MKDGKTTQFHSIENDKENAIPATLKNCDFNEYTKFLNERRILMARSIRRLFESL